MYLPLRFVDQNSVSIFQLRMRVLCLSPHVRDLIILRVLEEEYNVWSVSLCRFILPPVNSCFLGPNILFNILSNIFSPKETT